MRDPGNEAGNLTAINSFDTKFSFEFPIDKPPVSSETKPSLRMRFSRCVRQSSIHPFHSIGNQRGSKSKSYSDIPLFHHSLLAFEHASNLAWTEIHGSRLKKKSFRAAITQ